MILVVKFQENIYNNFYNKVPQIDHPAVLCIGPNQKAHGARGIHFFSGKDKPRKIYFVLLLLENKKS